MSLPVVWLDDALLVVNKPSGLLALPDGYDPSAPHLRSMLEPVYGRLWIVHRLDRETSGLVLLASSAAVHRTMNTQFEQRQVEKIYHAIVIGLPPWQALTVNQPLRINVGRRRRTAVDPLRGKPAETQLYRLQDLGAFSLVEARPTTGRTHQIRAHLAACGFPIAGDPLYGPGEAAQTPFARLMLHALSLRLVHPFTGEPLALKAPYPDDFQTVMSRLEKHLGS